MRTAACTHAAVEPCSCAPPPTLAPALGDLITAVTRAPLPGPGTAGIFTSAADAAIEAGTAPVLNLGGTSLDDLAELDGVPSMAAVTERPMIPLRIPGVPLIVPRADVTLAFGRGKIGKGRMTWALISAVTRDGGDVIIIAGEDKQDEQLRARCRASGSVPGRVWDLTRLSGSSVRFKLSAADPEKYPGHIAHLRAFIELLRRTCLAGHKNAPGALACEREGCGKGMHDPRLVVIDPLATVVGWGSMLNVAGARRLIEPLQDLADMTGVAIFCVGHTTKDGAKLAGSAGLEQALRLIYRIGVNPANAAYRVITVEQANNLPPGMDGLRFTVAEAEDGTARVEWITRAALDEQRTQWRERLAARQGAPAPGARIPARAALFTAAQAVRYPGAAPEARPVPGTWATLPGAQDACQAGAGQLLEWQPSTRRPGCWTATVYPSGPSGPEVSYAVSAAAGR